VPAKALGQQACSEQFTQNLKTLDIDSTTMGERLRAQEAWRSVISKLMRDLGELMTRGIDPKAARP
jgi:hypothetical protein